MQTFSIGNYGKAHESRVRRMARRRGLVLRKSRSRDPRSTDYGTFMLVNDTTDTVEVWGLQSGYGLSLDEVEVALKDYAS